MTGLILDSALILLLLGALAYGVRLETKLKALRAGQGEFARAVGELNGAAMRAESAMLGLRSAAEETDELHGRIVAARQLKQELERLIERGRSTTPAAAPVYAEPAERPRSVAVQPPAREPYREPREAGERVDPAAILQALAAHRLRGERDEPSVKPDRYTTPVRPAARGADDDLFETPRARRA